MARFKDNYFKKEMYNPRSNKISFIVNMEIDYILSYNPYY